MCGYRAYPWLPYEWSGSCYLGYVIPHMRLLTNSSVQTSSRSKRAIIEIERFFMITFPLYGNWKVARELIDMAAALELLANENANSLADIDAEVVTIRTVTMQNCIALDLLLAAQGGICAVVGSECCTYIPDNSEKTDNLAVKIRAEGAKYHDYNKGWEFWSWLKEMFGRWGA